VWDQDAGRLYTVGRAVPEFEVSQTANSPDTILLQIAIDSLEMAPTTEVDYLAQCDRLCSYRPSLGPNVVFPGFDPSPCSFEDGDMRIDYNEDIPMRDGIRLRADVFRPLRTEDPLPVVLAITPYGKQNPFDVAALPPSRDFDAGFDGVKMSKHTVFEGSDPQFWTNRGFAYVAIDARGSYASEGEKANFVSKADGIDGFDAVEYLATLPWSNGHVGMIGASALGAIQWYGGSPKVPSTYH
jgi:predicted acyl esterase